MAKATKNCCRGVTITMVYLDRSVPENTPVETGCRPFSKTEPVLFLHVTRPTEYISSAPSQPPLAFATYTILIPLWAASGHAPRPRNDSNIPPLPKESISGLPPLVVPHERTPHDPRWRRLPLRRPTRFRDQLRTVGYSKSSCGPGQVTSLSEL